MSFLNDMTVTQLNNAIPILWDDKVRLDAARKSFFGKFVGNERSNMPIIERKDFTQEPGNQINIQIMSQLLQEGVTGDTTLEDNEEQFTLGQISITPNVLRHAVAINWRAKKQINFDAIMGIGNTLSSWLARRIDEDLWNEVLNNNTPAIMYAGNAANQAQLSNTCVLGSDELSRGRVALERQGALPIKTVMDGEGEVDWYGCVISEVDAYQLKQDPIWKNNLQYADVRGDKNRIFTGALGFFDGIWVYVYRGVKFGGRLGSYLRPECVVSTALTSSATTLTVGTNANVNYTKFFQATGTLLINNEQITYTGKTNTTFTGLARGANNTQAATQAVNSLVTQNNLGLAFFFGAEIAARAWGLDPTRITDVRDYGFEQGIGIMSYYGQRAIANSSNLIPNSVLMYTYSPNPNNI
jgi:N4-gp56 family major capsid protein